ncbi:MAG TPA: DUF1003 domain-containing protein [Mesorhizobium sp.]|jgi:uncharacterized membrane protein|nr:DUF1003 domain-containing protein [Mesorhizobium sp.]
MISTKPPSRGDGRTGLTGTLERNIAALVEHRRRQKRRLTVSERIAKKISAFAGSMAFVYLHAAVYGFWILANLGWVPVVEPWDPTMVVLAMIASVEAIFISTFILISQNQMVEAEDRRAELDLQVSLLAEHEITKLVAMVSDIAARLDVPVDDREVSEMKENVAPVAVLEKIEEVAQQERQDA